MTSPKEEKPKSSIHAFVEQTARMLRQAVSSYSKKTRLIIHKTDLSNKNKIEQIARMLRTQADKLKKRVKRGKK